VSHVLLRRLPDAIPQTLALSCERHAALPLDVGVAVVNALADLNLQALACEDLHESERWDRKRLLGEPPRILARAKSGGGSSEASAG